MRSLPNTCTHDWHWESNPKPVDLESSTLSTQSLALMTRNRVRRMEEMCCNENGLPLVLIPPWFLVSSLVTLSSHELWSGHYLSHCS